MPPKTFFLFLLCMLCNGPFSTSIQWCAATVVTDTCLSKRNAELSDKTTDSWMFREILLRTSSAKLACSVLCAQEPSCITFMINRDSRLCRLYGTRITRYNTLTDAAGFVAYDTCRANDAFGSICTSTTDCLLANTVCTENVCQCNYGWSYSPSDRACIRKCVEYGLEFTEFPHHFVSKNNAQNLYDSQYLNREACAAACVSATTFVCRTFEMDFDVSVCRLQEVTQFDVPGSFHILPGREIHYHQRHCK